MTRLFFELFFLIFYFAQSHAMMIRNDALISKMMSDFQKDNTMGATQHSPDQPQQPQLQPTHQQSHQQSHQPSHQQSHVQSHKSQQELQSPDIMSMMQNVLCKNFPTIPCGMIVEDNTLRNLIERSIQQLKYKKLSMEKTTAIPGYHLTLFPSINSEDLSNFLQVSENGYYKNKAEKSRSRKHKKRLAKSNVEHPTGERDSKKKNKSKKDNTRTTLYSGRKIRKFYPHKVKYKDKSKGRKDFVDYSEEKLSMSVEVPDMNMGGVGIAIGTGRKRSDHVNFKMEPVDSPVWRIDYMKHGEPSLNVFGYEPDRLKEKLVKTGPNVIVSENVLEQASRKDVLHPDVYIKKNFIRKNALDMNSGAID